MESQGNNTTVKGLLKELIMYNTSDPNKFSTTDENGTHKSTIKDLQELNMSDLYTMADLLGMSDLY